MKKTWTTIDGQTFDAYDLARKHEKTLMVNRIRTKGQLIARLQELQEEPDTERAHRLADKALLEYINNNVVEIAFNDIQKWYT